MKVWLISADMGYGHQRAAEPLKFLAEEKIISIGTDDVTSTRNKRKWARLQNTYEFVSRNKKFSFIGKYLYKLMNSMQAIPSFYPKKDLSKINLAVKILDGYIKDGLYDNLIELVSKKRLPVLTTFYAPAIALDYHGFDDIYCVVTDSDINRVWAAKNPSKSRVKYFVPSEIAQERLKQYGIPSENIFLSGFPIDIDEIVSETGLSVQDRLAQRLKTLDTFGNFYKLHSGSVEKILGIDLKNITPNEKPVISFAVGGAGAQKELAKKIIAGLFDKLQKDKIRLNLIAGIRTEVRDYFRNLTEKSGVKNTEIIFADTKEEYFHKFNKTIGETDILWTKPSELVFFSSLGIPIILAPPIGAQESSNRQWLRDDIGAGIIQQKPKFCGEWLDDFMKSGKLAEAAWLGYLKVERNGVKNIVRKIKKWNNNE
jgi:hypothetical protein